MRVTGKLCWKKSGPQLFAEILLKSVPSEQRILIFSRQKHVESDVFIGIRFDLDAHIAGAIVRDTQWIVDGEFLDRRHPILV